MNFSLLPSILFGIVLNIQRFGIVVYKRKTDSVSSFLNVRGIRSSCL